MLRCIGYKLSMFTRPSMNDISHSTYISQDRYISQHKDRCMQIGDIYIRIKVQISTTFSDQNYTIMPTKNKIKYRHKSCMKSSLHSMVLLVLSQSQQHTCFHPHLLDTISWSFFSACSSSFFCACAFESSSTSKSIVQTCVCSLLWKASIFWAYSSGIAYMSNSECKFSMV